MATKTARASAEVTVLVGSGENVVRLSADEIMDHIAIARAANKAEKGTGEWPYAIVRTAEADSLTEDEFSDRAEACAQNWLDSKGLALQAVQASNPTRTNDYGRSKMLFLNSQESEVAPF
jgi:hypothetical protein